jgi:hypothetical protein
MKSVFPLILFAIVVALIAVSIRGYSNSVNLYHVCDKEVTWYEAAFLDKIESRASCEKYQ